MRKDWTCGSCKFMAQGENCCYCNHKNAFKDKAQYIYYFFSCPKHRPGIHKSILAQSPNYDSRNS